MSSWSFGSSSCGSFSFGSSVGTTWQFGRINNSGNVNQNGYWISCCNCQTNVYSNQTTSNLSFRCSQCGFVNDNKIRQRLRYLRLFGTISRELVSDIPLTHSPPFFIGGIDKPQIRFLNNCNKDCDGIISFTINLKDIYQSQNYQIEQVYVIFISQPLFDQTQTKLRNNNNNNNGNNVPLLTDNDIIKEIQRQYSSSNMLQDIIDSKKVFRGQKENDEQKLNDINFSTLNTIDTRNTLGLSNCYVLKNKNKNRNQLKLLNEINGSQFVLYRKNKDDYNNRFDINFDKCIIGNSLAIDKNNSYYMGIQCCVYDPCLNDKHFNQLPRSPFSVSLIENIHAPKYDFEIEWEKEGLTIKYINNNNNNINASSNNKNNNNKSGATVELTKLGETHEDYTCVAYQFYSTLAKIDYEIVGIYSISNALQELVHSNFQEQCLMRLNNDSTKLNTMSLWHGTKFGIISTLLHQGFVKALCVRAAYGIGCYFARDSSFSDGYCEDDKSGIRHMFLCSVIVGEYCKGEAIMKIPPNKPNSKIQFETTVNDVRRPSIFVTHNDGQALPRYIVAYKCRNKT